ncbi:hypothetical protein AB0M02_11255 [Actinoplanes sp. NPDC051861]|uniref:hypothetical protein n=1 Tax=Actinoplanes sp. NPDC051861 TaxID=3155170 RepID=UPI00341FE782
MTTRRSLLLLAGTGLALTATGCREPAAATPATAPDVLLADTGSGLVRLSPTGAQPLGTAAAAFDGAHLYATGSTGLEQIDPATGEAVRRSALGDGWLPRVVSTDGRVCALSEAAGATVPAARTRTPLVVMDSTGPRKFNLPGVIEPDAFTSDGTGLFVLDWLPATAPDHYRVRLLDLGTGQIQPLLTRNKTPVPTGAEEEMRGEGRQAVLSADKQMLFTLYTHQPGHAHTRDLLSGRPGNAHAFVHVLHLTERWAFCLDLPHPFGEGAPGTCALAANARYIAVADLAAGKLAYCSAPSLTVERLVAIPAGDAPAALALSPDGRTLVGAGDRVTVLDTTTGATASSWKVPGPVRGLGLTVDGKRLYAGVPDGVAWFDTASGTVAGEQGVPGLTALRHVI